MEPDEFSDFNDAASAIAGMLWSMFKRLIAEGATPIEAALISSTYVAAIGWTNPDNDKEGGDTDTRTDD